VQSVMCVISVVEFVHEISRRAFACSATECNAVRTQRISKEKPGTSTPTEQS
jgi:hypothetical protein